MELVWNNPSPNRRAYRAPVWEVLRRNGTRKLISTHEIYGIAEHKLDLPAKEAINDLPGFFFCF